MERFGLRDDQWIGSRIFCRDGRGALAAPDYIPSPSSLHDGGSQSDAGLLVVAAPHTAPNVPILASCDASIVTIGGLRLTDSYHDV